MENYDLIIVGGGPAGATAALYAQRQGLTTLLLDKERFPRDKICGDALSGKTVAILHELALFEEVCDLVYFDAFVCVEKMISRSVRRA